MTVGCGRLRAGEQSPALHRWQRIMFKFRKSRWDWPIIGAIIGFLGSEVYFQFIPPVTDQGLLITGPCACFSTLVGALAGVVVFRIIDRP